MIKATLTLVFLIAALTLVQAQQTALITNPGGRTTVSLDGQWRTIVDPYETGYYDYRYQPGANGYFKDAKPKSKSDLIEYNFDTADTLKVPGDWNSQRERLLLYEGTIWYRKLFDHQKKPGTRLFVYFGAANYLADVYLNGQKLGRHEGGFTAFNFEITDLVREQGNSLIVKVDDKRHREGVPTLNTDWWNYGGLTREVKLIETPTAFIEDYFIQLQKGSRNHVAGWVRLNGAAAGQKITVRIPEAMVEQTVTADTKGYAEIGFDAKVTLWSPDAPKLYDVEIEAGADQVREQIGFRSIETKGPDVLLNGKPIFLRGISIHEEAPFRGGRAFSDEDAVTLLRWAKELGCNFVRLAHYPHNENMVKEADKLGLMVWSEIPVYWTILWENPETFANAANQLNEMITRDRNRASIIIWSMANETPILEPRTTFLRNLAERARQQDPTRLISAALERHYLDAEQRIQMIDDPLGEYLDVLGCNEYVGWYDGLPEKMEGMEWRSKYQKPLIMSEFGADAQYGLHGDALTRWSEEYQEDLYRRTVKMLNGISFLRGTSPWILMDFRSPRRPLPGIQDFYNRKGLISDRGQKKKAFYVLQQYYREKAAAGKN
jgi:beta-glucuronidase